MEGKAQVFYICKHMGRTMNRKVAVVWISLAMMLSLIVIVVDVAPPVKAAIITVDDSGGANYLTIQEGIDAASPGDTVFVYNGTYYENVVVDKTINLTGEDRDKTIIDGGGFVGSGIVILVNAFWVNITGFNVTNSGNGISDVGMKLEDACYCSIIRNNFTLNRFGVVYVYD